MEENPFPDLDIDSTDYLDSIPGRQKCPKCQKSRKYYCYTCYVPVPEIADRVPVVKLPLKIDVIKHPSEVDGKSTAIHAAIIAPDDVTVYTYPCIPDYDDKEKVVLVFPGETSITLAELAKKLNTIFEEPNHCKRKLDDGECSDTRDGKSYKNTKLDLDKNLGTVSGRKSCEVVDVFDNTEKYGHMNKDIVFKADSCDTQTESQNTNSEKNSRIVDSCLLVNESQNSNGRPKCILEKVIFIDSTWNQSRSIYKDERLKGLQCVELKTRETKFWRHQRDIPNTYLSTVEAMYYFLREFHDHFVSNTYRGEYDNILFFFKFMHGKIRTLYDGGDDLKAYKDRKKKETVLEK